MTEKPWNPDDHDVLGKLPGESDADFLKRTGQEVTPVTTEELKGILEHQDTVNRLTKLEEEKSNDK